MAADRFTPRSGRAMYVQETGSGLPLLALHGLGGGAWFFTGLARRLAPSCRVIAVDLPGTGRSGGSTAQDLSLAGWVADLADLLAARVAGPVVILGHSLGTILALEAWASWPQAIRALIFVGGLPQPRPLIRERLALRAEAVARTGLDGVGPSAATANFARATLERQPELVALFERLFEAQDAATYVRWCHLLIDASAAAIVPTVGVPCLSVSGTEDQYAPPELVTAFVGRLPVSCRQDVLEDCGHLPFLEQPARFAALVKSFLDTLC